MNKKKEFGLRSLIYIFLFIILLFFFGLAKQLIIQNTSTPYWSDIINLKIAIICFFIIIVCFEIWFLYYNRIKKIFLKNEFLVYSIIIIIFLTTNLILQFTSPTTGDIRYTAHVGFLISQGMSIYLDFVEIHSPLYGYIMAPFFLLFEGLMPLHMLHILSFLALLASVFALYKVGKEIFENKRYAFLMAILFLSFKNIIVSYNVRFDVFAALFLIVSYFYIIRGRKCLDYVYGGFFIAVSFLFVQKTLLQILGILAILFLTDKKVQVKIKKIFYFCCGMLFPLGAVYSFMFLKIGSEGLRRYFILNFIYPYARIWQFKVINKLVSYCITNVLHIFLILIGLFIFVKYYRRLKKFKFVLLTILLNFAIVAFFIMRGGRISPQDFMYFIPFLSISGVVSIIYISKKITGNLERYFYFFFMLLLIAVPFSLTALNITVPGDNHEIKFYLNSFMGEQTNCNLLYNDIHRYYFTEYESWFENEAFEFFDKYQIPVRGPSLEDMINQDFKIICTALEMPDNAKETLLNNSYISYNYKNHLSEKMFVKKKNGL
ncbi:glycosyltransferase family 39 protein [Candidatus Woesearchaeota archaeon]|nr:glycosyltransferase family 39 protein [Candidatus Woesearchaeota archaeon]